MNRLRASQTDMDNLAGPKAEAEELLSKERELASKEAALCQVHVANAEKNVATMQQELTDLQPVLKQSQKDTDALMEEIEENWFVENAFVSLARAVSLGSHTAPTRWVCTAPRIQ